MALALAEPARVSRLVVVATGPRAAGARWLVRAGMTVDGGHLAPLLTRHGQLVAEVSAFLTEGA